MEALAIHELAAVIGAGLFAGFINVLAGGGSMITLPALMLTGLPADVANGTNRLAIVAQSATGVAGFQRNGKLPTGALVGLLAPTLVGAAIGAVVATHVPREVLKPILLGMMIVMATLIAVRKELLVPKTDQAQTLGEKPSAIIGLFVTGLYAGFIQAGAGFLFLGVLGGMLGYDLVRANAIKLVSTVIFGTVVLGIFIAASQFAVLPAIVLALASVIGARIGVHVALRIDLEVFRWVVFVCVVATCIAAWFRG